MGTRNTFLEINLPEIFNNYQKLLKHSQKPVFAVIKDDAYAHGAIEVAKTLKDICPYFCVSSLDEALKLRDGGIESPILVLGYEEDVKLCVEKNITLSITSLEHLEKLIKINQNKALKVHLNIDTGMNRFGIKRIDEFLKAVQLADRYFELEGVYTHLYDADNEDPHSEMQLKRFYHFIDETNYSFKWIHTSNSAGSILLKDQRANANRVGLALYGIGELSEKINLKKALALKSEIVQVKPVFKNETIGYDGTYHVKKNSYIAVVPIGYGDGLLRINQGRFVNVDNHPCEIIGRICMDQMMILLDEPKEIHTPVEIIGEYIDIDEMARELKMLVYEVLVLFNGRLEKRYIRNRG